jgi:SAM-dependent methyltransferase
MFWFDKSNPDTVYMDNRTLDTTLCDGRRLVVSPDVVGDFRDIPFADGSFRLVVFDPPHLVRAGETSWTAKKYGVLGETWPRDLRQGFDECMRVLEPSGILVFKWNEDQIKLSEILALIPYKPLFGDKRSKTHWLVFMKKEATQAGKGGQNGA